MTHAETTTTTAAATTTQTDATPIAATPDPAAPFAPAPAPAAVAAVAPAPPAVAPAAAGAPMAPAPEAASPLSERERAATALALKRLAVRSHSQVIYFFPTVLAAGACALLGPVDGGAWGNIFLPVFFANLMFVIFDFNSLRTLILALFAATGGLAAWSFGFLAPISELLSGVHVSMNAQAFAAFAVFFGVLMLGDFIWSHLNRWEFSANEVKHIQAFRGHTSNYPGRGLRFQVRTKDVFERLLLGSGTLVLLVGRRKVEIKNVIFAHRKVKQLETFIRTTGVFSDDADVFDDDLEDDDDEV